MYWKCIEIDKKATHGFNKYPLVCFQNFGSKFLTPAGLVTAAVNESLREEQSLEEVCIAWICDNNTVMENTVTENGTAIRNVTFTNFDLMEFYGKTQQKGKFSQVMYFKLSLSQEHTHQFSDLWMKETFKELILPKRKLMLVLGMNASSQRRRISWRINILCIKLVKKASGYKHKVQFTIIDCISRCFYKS